MDPSGTSKRLIEHIREEFPVLHQKVNGNKLIYFDNAASMQKPQVVIRALSDYYESINSNVHRGVHYLSQEATNAFEVTRRKLADHLNAAQEHEVIFTRGTTESINMVASGLWKFFRPGDEIIVSAMEHHSNIVPWQMLCERTGAVLRVIPMDEQGVLDIGVYAKLLHKKTKLVSVSHVSNALGTINPVAEIISLAHNVGAAVLVDGAQAVPHMSVDVQALDADFYAFSAHKMYGPTGVGALYGKTEWLEKLEPWQGGGEMIETVTFEKTTYAGLPHRLEAGTPHIAGVIAWASSIDWMNDVGLSNIEKYEGELLRYGTDVLNTVKNLNIYGTAPEKSSVISFNIKNLHPYDVGVLLDQFGIAVRTGHHCAQPVMDFYQIPGTLRASFAVYNTREEIDRLAEDLNRAIHMLQ